MQKMLLDKARQGDKIKVSRVTSLLVAFLFFFACASIHAQYENGSLVGTSFGSIPFNNTVQGHLTEIGLSGQYSRFSLKVKEKFGANDVTGYLRR